MCDLGRVAMSYLDNLLSSLQIVKEYERAIIFRLGRIVKGGAKGPGNARLPITPMTQSVTVSPLYPGLICEVNKCLFFTSHPVFNVFARGPGYRNRDRPQAEQQLEFHSSRHHNVSPQ